MAASASIPEPSIALVDGRHVRRDRNRDAVVTATIELLLDGKGIPLLQQIADRSGVSLRSLHRYFADADAVVAEAYATYLVGHPATPAAVPPAILCAPLPDRGAGGSTIAANDCRRTNGAFLAIVARANRSARLQDAVEATREGHIQVVRVVFAPELAVFAEAERARRLALAHTATTSESWDNLTRRHGLDEAQVRTVWTRTLLAALAPDASDASS